VSEASKTSSNQSKPPGWGTDGLSAFLKMAGSNQASTFALKKPEYKLLSDIDDAFCRIGNNLVNPKSILGANMLFRSHAAYRGSCGLCMSGQVAETFVLLRSCLEYAAYGLHIFKNPALGETWLNRNEDAASLKAVRRAFRAIDVQKTVAGAEARLGEVYEQLYERSINFGAHPNVLGVTASMTMQRDTDQTQLQHLYLHDDDLTLAMGLKSTAQVGATSLHIFQYVFQERFMLLGVRELLMELRKQNL